MIEEFVLDHDITETLFGDAEDVEMIKKSDHEYMIGRLTNGTHVVKWITYFGGFNTKLRVIGAAIRWLRNQDTS